MPVRLRPSAPFSTVELSDVANGFVIADAIKIVRTATTPLPSGASGIFYYHNDHLGTPQVLTDATQAIVWEGDYDPFGEVTITAGSITNNLRFPGQYYDAETNLHYNWNRYYDPSLGRYITSDPIGLNGGINTYLYALANPIVFTDPEGLRVVGGRGGDASQAGTGFGSINVGVSASYMAGTTGGSVSAGVAIGSNNNRCFYTLICVRAGYGYAASLSIAFSLSNTKLCSGTYKIYGASFGGGTGVTGSGSVRTSGKGASIGRGTIGVGGGGFGGAEACELRLWCNKDDCNC